MKFAKGFDSFSDEFPGEWVKLGNEILPQAIGPINAGNLKEPFFLWIHLSDPHEAYKIKYQTDNKDEQRKLIQQEYLRKVQLTGLYAEEIMSSIKKSKYRFNTLTVFTSDHGEGLGNHDWDGHVENVYNELIHVPLWFKYPIVGDEEALKNNQVARSIDLAPTILDILHIKTNVSCDGSSLLEDKERIAYSETHKPDASKDKYSFILNNEKCIYTPETAVTECYMLSTDPYETTPMNKPFSLTGEALLQRMIDRDVMEQPNISQEDKEQLQAARIYKMTKIAPLTQDIVEKRKEFKNKYHELESMVLNRMDYVLRESMNILNYKVDWWDTQSEEAKYYLEHGSDNCITGDTWYPNDWVVNAKKGSVYEPDEESTTFINKFGKEHSLFADAYPTRWLFEDFEQELSDGRFAYLEKKIKDQETKKIKLEKEKTKKALLKEQAKSKLTAEEQKALGL